MRSSFFLPSFPPIKQHAGADNLFFDCGGARLRFVTAAQQQIVQRRHVGHAGIECDCRRGVLTIDLKFPDSTMIAKRPFNFLTHRSEVIPAMPIVFVSKSSGWASVE